MSDEAPPGLTEAYAPPVNEPRPTRARLHQNAHWSGYRPRIALLRVLCSVLLLEALLGGLNAACCALLASERWPPNLNYVLDQLSHAVSKAYPALFFAGTIPFAWFLVGSNKNARAFVRAILATTIEDDDETEEDDEREQRVRSVPVLRYTPASMAWWFVIPFLNLVQPYLAVKAVWSASRPEHANGQVESTRLLRQWWLSYLVALIMPRVGSLLTSRRVGFTNHNLVAALSNLVGAVAVMLALRLVLALHERQATRAAELWPTDSSTAVRAQPVSE